MKATVRVDERYGPYEGIWIDPVVFSEDSRHWATRVVTKKEPYLLLDGRKIDVDPVVSTVHFSPDGQHLAYTITKNTTKEFLVIDETEFKAYTEIGGDKMEFSSDGSLTLFPREGESKLYRVKVSALK
jgi:hypothetical protein